MKRVLRTILVLIVLLLPTATANASDVPEYIIKQCREKAQKMKLTRVTYKFGKLILDNTGSTSLVKQKCLRESAAGCFEHTTARYRYGISGTETFSIGRYTCVVPKLYVNYSWVDAHIYMTKEYNPCQRRVVLRHELQHFTIWKTAQNNILIESKRALKQLALDNIKVISAEDDPRLVGSVYDIKALVGQKISDVNRKWNSIASSNNTLLDQVDHNMETEVNYRVCMPYSIELL